MTDFQNFGEEDLMGTCDDWKANVLGQKVFGESLRAFVSSADGISRAVVEFPRIPSDVTAGGLAGFFRAASGVAARQAYVVVQDDDYRVGSSSSAGSFPGRHDQLDVQISDSRGVIAQGETLWGEGPAGGLLTRMNDIAMARAGISGDSQIASGHCYEVLFLPERRGQVSALLGRWPTLRRVLGMHSDWFVDSVSLQRVGVSVRNGAVHFESGWGNGVLTAFDVVAVSGRSKLYPSDGVDELLSMPVGGDDTSDVPDVHTDCRRSVLLKLGLEKLAVWGKDRETLEASPGWAAFVGGCQGDDVRAYSFTCRKGGLEVCSCWHKAPSIVRLPCKACGFVVNPEGHEVRCGTRGATVRADTGVKREAWIGDALQQLDVREALLKVVAYDEAVRLLEKYTSAAGQARYLRRGKSSFVTLADASDWFEANYKSFRDSYCVWMSDDLRRFLDGGEEFGEELDDGDVGGTSLIDLADSGGRAMIGAKLSAVVEFVKRNDLYGFVQFVKSNVSVGEFGLFEECVQVLGIKAPNTSIDMVCRPVQPGSMNGEVFERLAKEWLQEDDDLGVALYRIVRGRSVANVSKKGVVRAIKSI